MLEKRRQNRNYRGIRRANCPCGLTAPRFGASEIGGRVPSQAAEDCGSLRYLANVSRSPSSRSLARSLCPGPEGKNSTSGVSANGTESLSGPRGFSGQVWIHTITQ